MNKKVITKIFNKVLITVVITLLILILIKSNSSFKSSFYKQVYKKNISYALVNKLYNKYIGKLDIVNKVAPTQAVFNEKLEYKKIEMYKDGARLSFDSTYLVPVQESGVVVFIGTKDGYNNTVIIQRIDGIDQWYGNIKTTDLKLYDYVKKGSLLGEVDKKLYMVYKKNGKVLKYEDYIK